MITYQFRLNAKKSDITKFKCQLEVHRLLYNNCLSIKKTKYEQEKKNITCFDLIKSEVPKFKGLSNYSSMQQTVRRLDKAYKKFFKLGGFPRFKQEDSFSTIEFARIGDGCKIKKDSIYIQYIGDISCNFHREIPNDLKVKTLSITYKQNSLYVNIICEKYNGKYNTNKNSIGIDFGIIDTITTSDGEKIQSPKLLKNKLGNIRRLNRQKVKDGKKNKAKKALQKIYNKIANKRKDFNHKLSRKIIEEYGIICLENLKVNDIKSYRPINRRLFDIGINQLINFISYKAESAGKKVITVNPAYTTQDCSRCGKRIKKDLKTRIHKCKCGLEIDRDENAALNILRLGLQSLEQS